MEPGQAQDPRNDAMAQTLPVLAACRQYWCGAREEENAREVSYHRGFAYQNNPDYRKSKEKQLRASLLAIRESERETEGHIFCFRTWASRSFQNELDNARTECALELGIATNTLTQLRDDVSPEDI